MTGGRAWVVSSAGVDEEGAGQVITSDRSGTAHDAAVRRLVDVVRDHVRLIDTGGPRPPGWRYPSVFHFLLAHGRVFTPAPRPPGLDKMPDGACRVNAAHAARTYGEHDLVYAGGMAAYHRPGVAVHLPHAWCVTRDGTAVDPTWDADGGTIAYFGVPLADRTLWPAYGEGLLEDFMRCAPLLRDGFSEAAYAPRGHGIT
ncbi:hypothetical protein [Catenuloplanes indicus]